jgi:dCMP deaminase
MIQALIASMRSPDPNTQVGAYICSEYNRPLGLGYNGLPRGIEPDSIDWAREGEPQFTKYPYIVHAEKNAIFNSNSSLKGSKLYVTLHPCNNCALDIIQAGISEVLYLANPYKDLWQTECAKWMLSETKIKVGQFQWQHPKLIQKHLKNLFSQAILEQLQ